MDYRSHHRPPRPTLSLRDGTISTARFSATFAEKRISLHCRRIVSLPYMITDEVVI